jgi:hypothetical protein
MRKKIAKDVIKEFGTSAWTEFNINKVILIQLL